MVKQILIVCIGNICRSPSAESLLRKSLGDSNIEISSAGLAALEGSPIEPTALLVLEEHGYGFSEHKARQLIPQFVRESDLILVMEKHHIEGVLSMVPEARGKIFLLGKWQDNREIRDPYRQGKPAFVHAYALMSEAANAWAKRLAC